MMFLFRSLILQTGQLDLKKNNYIADLEPVESVHCIEPQSWTHSKISELPDQLATLLYQLSDELNWKEKDEVENVLTEFEVIFIKPDGKMGYTDLVEHNINTGYDNPIKYLLVDYLLNKRNCWHWTSENAWTEYHWA